MFDACDALKNVLDWLGARVTALTSAQQALELLETPHAEAIVLILECRCTMVISWFANCAGES
jgi:CheY-like chemotaxis protein